MQSDGPDRPSARARRTSAVRNPQSKRALWATKARPASAAIMATWSKVGTEATIRSVMPVSPLNARGNGHARIDQRLEHQLPPGAVHHHHGDVGEGMRWPAGPHAGGLHVDHGEAALLHQRRALHLRDERPAAIIELAHPGVGGEERHRQPLRHRAGRARHPQHLRGDPTGVERPPQHQQHGALHQGPLGKARQADHSAARASGRVMQRGPPPPRESSSPSMVTTVRCLVSSQSSKATKSTLETARKPACLSASMVPSLRR